MDGEDSEMLVLVSRDALPIDKELFGNAVEQLHYCYWIET